MPNSKFCLFQIFVGTLIRGVFWKTAIEYRSLQANKTWVLIICNFRFLDLKPGPKLKNPILFLLICEAIALSHHFWQSVYSWNIRLYNIITFVVLVLKRWQGKKPHIEGITKVYINVSISLLFYYTVIRLWHSKQSSISTLFAGCLPSRLIHAN